MQILWILLSLVLLSRLYVLCLFFVLFCLLFLNFFIQPSVNFYTWYFWLAVTYSFTNNVESEYATIGNK